MRIFAYEHAHAPVPFSVFISGLHCISFVFGPSTKLEGCRTKEDHFCFYQVTSLGLFLST